MEIILGAHMCLCVMRVTKDIAALSNMESVEIIYGVGEEYLIVWRQDISWHVQREPDLICVTGENMLIKGRMRFERHSRRHVVHDWAREEKVFKHDST